MEIDDLASELARLEKEEAALLEARALASKTSLTQSLKDVDRCLEGVKRAIPELDIVAKTAGELRTSIRKTMERADVVSVKVRELDQSRSRALEALEYAKRCVEARACVKGAREAIAKHDLEVAASYVKRFDDVSKQDVLPGASEMQHLRAELERSILEISSPSTSFGAGPSFDSIGVSSSTGSTSPSLQHRSVPALRNQASANNWLESEILREALKQASVMSKVSDSAAAESRYAHFLASYLKERVSAEFERVNISQFESGNAVDESKVFVDALKYLFNSSAALIDANTRIPEMVLASTSRPVIFKCINAECDRQCTLLFDSFMSGRRLHERAGRQEVEKDLSKLNHLLVEICIAMQHVETYDRFVRSRPFFVLAEHNPEYRRIVQEVAGAYTLLEKKWITESLKRARREENTVAIIASGRPLDASSLVEDAFYVCRRAIKRALGTGSSEATCGCVNLAAACLEDTLLPFFSVSASQHQTQSGSSTSNSSETLIAKFTIQINSLELSVEYCNKLFQHITSTDAFERAEDLAKVKSCAEGLLELADRFESRRLETVTSLIQQACAGSVQWRSAMEAIEAVSYQLDDQQFEREDNFAAKLSSVAPSILKSKLHDSLSDVSFERLVETLSLKLAEDLERGIVVKRFTQLGAMKLEKDLRHISESFIAMVSNSLGVRAIFARLMQIANVLSVFAIEEAHDVWDSFASSTNALVEVAHTKGIRPKDKLTAKEMKRVLALRIDFDQREIQRIKLL